MLRLHSNIIKLNDLSIITRYTPKFRRWHHCSDTSSPAELHHKTNSNSSSSTTTRTSLAHIFCKTFNIQKPHYCNSQFAYRIVCASASAAAARGGEIRRLRSACAGVIVLCTGNSASIIRDLV